MISRFTADRTDRRGRDSATQKRAIRKKRCESVQRRGVNQLDPKRNTFATAARVSMASQYGARHGRQFCDWAFNLPRGEPIREKWRLIPTGVDVLLTHGPPLGHGDTTHNRVRAGCLDLLAEVQQRVRPQVHAFGHIHEAYGATSDGVTTYLNAATCTIR